MSGRISVRTVGKRDDEQKRRQQFLDAAAALIVRLGYDKVTMGDIAEETGASRRTVYLYFNGKDELFDALMQREYMDYSKIWLDQIERDPHGGSVGGVYRAMFYALDNRPLMAAMMRRDRRVLGTYLRKPGNVFSRMLSGVNGPEFFGALQKAGAIRADINPSVIEHFIEIVLYGHLAIGDIKPQDEFPPFDDVMHALAELMDRALRPSTGGDGNAAKRIIRQITAAAREQMNLMQKNGSTKTAPKKRKRDDKR